MNLRSVAPSLFASLLVGSLALGCGPADVENQSSDDTDAEGQDATTGVSFSQNKYGVTFTNGDGEWGIFTGCYGPKARGGGHLTVGPGYVAKVVLNRESPSGDKTIIDDNGPLHDPNGNLIGFTHPGYSALGGFAWHHSRGHAPYGFTWNNAWEMAGRVCAEDHGGFGVSGATIVEEPTLSPTGVGLFAIDVTFSDPWSPILTVRYVYRVYQHVVKMWAVVTEHCPNGNCGVGAPGAAYIGEPKFVSAISGGGYRRMAIFNELGDVAVNKSSGNAACLWTGADPYDATGQCDGDHRVRARFDYGSLKSGGYGRCDATTYPCLNTVMQAYPVDPGGGITPEKAPSLWENSSLGLDHWAKLSASREAVNSKDSKAGGAKWSCHGGSTGSDINRRWELVGLEKNAADEYKYAAFYFHAWESGTGVYDCEPMSRRFGPNGEQFAVHAEFSINDGWSLE